MRNTRIESLSTAALGAVLIIGGHVPFALAGDAPGGPAAYEGKFCSGEGDVEFLRLIDESFAFFNPNPIVPNLTMVYKPEWDTLVEAGGWNAWWIQNSYGFSYAALPALVPVSGEKTAASAELPEALKKPFAVLSAMDKLLAGEQGADYERAFVSAALSSCEDYRVRAAMDPGPGYYRPITPKRRVALTEFYEQTALGMYNGFGRRMVSCAEKGDARQKRLAALFAEAQKL